MVRSLYIIFIVLSANISLYATTLDDYIRQPDSSYSYEQVQSIKKDNIAIYFLKMTSQTWLDTTMVSPSKWEHWLIIYIPEELLHHDKALLIIGSGNNKSDDTPALTQYMEDIANQTHSVVASLKMVPNQPVVFADDPTAKERYEDSIIAYSLKKAKENDDYNRITLLPMVKSAVRAMDTVQDFCFKKSNGQTEIRDFVVTGASKRGWTTWLTAAVDSRVIAIAPVVIDFLNIGKQMEHHFNAYGFYSEAVKDYENNNILQTINSPESQKLCSIIDPYCYINRLTMPKYLINSAQDQFFVTDSSQFYYNDLKGEKLLRYIPNADHSLKNTNSVEGLFTFYYTILNDLPRPNLLTNKITDNKYEIIPQNGTPVNALLWQAENPDSRDFRLSTIGACWESTELKPTDSGSYQVSIPRTGKGYLASFVELIFEIAPGKTMSITTETTVIPCRE